MNNKTRNSTVGKLIVATENEHKGTEVGSLHSTQPSVIKLKGYVKEEGPKNREMIHRKTSVKPSLIVAKIPEDDDEEDLDDLPIRKLPSPIVAPLRKTRLRVRPGSMRSNILAGIIHPANNPRVLVASTKTTLNNPRESSFTQNATASENQATKPLGGDGDQAVLVKIKTLLLKSTSNPAQSPAETNAPSKKETGTKSKTLQINSPTSKPDNTPPAFLKASKSFPTTHANNDGLFIPSKLAHPTDAFSNHASVINRISEPRREALLIGIIKALLARDKAKTSSASRPMNGGAASGLPHYSRQAILQSLQNLQMRKTVGGDSAALPGEENPPVSEKNLEDMYQKEREDEVKQELGM